MWRLGKWKVLLALEAQSGRDRGLRVTAVTDITGPAEFQHRHIVPPPG